MKKSISNSTQSLTIDTFGSQILNWKIGFEDIFANNVLNPKRSGMPLMFPFCGPLKDSIFLQTGQSIGQHGFGRNVEWKIICHDQSKLELGISSRDLPIEFQKVFGFDYDCIFCVELGDNFVVFELLTINLGKTQLPLAPGFHPYFQIQSSQKDNIRITPFRDGDFLFDAKILPWTTGVEAQFRKNPVKFEVELPGKPNLFWEDLSCIKTQNIDISLPCDLLTIWAGEVGEWVCIEPMSKRFDSINVDPILLNYGQKYSLKYKIAF